MNFDLQRWKWTKNVKPQDHEFWAYLQFKMGHLFNLNWKEDKTDATHSSERRANLAREAF